LVTSCQSTPHSIPEVCTPLHCRGESLKSCILLRWRSQVVWYMCGAWHA
jgi:hypothetical protein